MMECCDCQGNVRGFDDVFESGHPVVCCVCVVIVVIIIIITIGVVLLLKMLPLCDVSRYCRSVIRGH